MLLTCTHAARALCECTVIATVGLARNPHLVAAVLWEAFKEELQRLVVVAGSRSVVGLPVWAHNHTKQASKPNVRWLLETPRAQRSTPQLLLTL